MSAAEPLPALAPSSALRPGSGQAEWKPAFGPWAIALTVMIGTFMEVLDTSIAVVSLPHIAGNLSAGIDESTWVLTSYLVSNAVILPLSGWLSAVFGRKRFYMFCLGLFTVSSFLCGLAPNLGLLVFFRILQGAGGGSLQPISQAILVESFPPRKRGIAMAVYAMGVVVAPIIGPTVGGWITDSYSWRWIFLINIPVGAVALLLCQMVVSDPPYLVRKDLRTVKIDYVGLGLISVGLATLQIVLDKGEREDWLNSHFIAILLTVSVLSLLGAIFWELRQKDPIVQLHLLKDRNFTISIVAMFLLGFVLYGSTTLIPIFLQTLLGYTAMLSGLVLSPGGVATLVALPIVGRLLSHYEPRWLMIVGILAVVVSLLMMAGFNVQVDMRMPVIARMIQGLGLAFLFVPINTMAFAFVPREEANHATGLINLARNIGGSCGIAFVATMLARGQQVHQNIMVGDLSPFNHAYRQAIDGASTALAAGGSPAPVAAHQAVALVYGAMQQQASMLSFIDDFRTLAILFLIPIPLLFLMRKTPVHGPAAAGH